MTLKPPDPKPDDPRLKGHGTTYQPPQPVAGHQTVPLDERGHRQDRDRIMSERPFQSAEDECGAGEERGPGQGCVMWEGHPGAHLVRPSGEDES